jgi:tetratricopeptide (TPR) repeat protein
MPSPATATGIEFASAKTMESKPLTLELVPFDQPKADTPPPAAPLALEIDIVPMGTKRVEAPPTDAGPDRFEREARRQYEEGHIDAPLWKRALAQANGDKEAAVVVYLRARATALRLLNRSLRTERRPPASVPPPAVAESVAEDASEASSRPARSRPTRPRLAVPGRYWIIGAAALVPVGAIAWFAIAHMGGGGPATDAPVAQVPPRSVAAASSAPPPASAPQAKSTLATASAKGVTPDFLKKIQDLADAGNWNLFVLYAVEWTRQEPANAAAWDRLRVGYVNMRQYDDAVAAAKKAAQLAPQDARLWRALGGAQMEVEDAKGALRSFEQAVALDAQDAESLKQVGVLHGRLGQAKEAKDALDASLALRPDDANTQCLRTALAQAQMPVKDTQVVGRQAKPFDDRCRSVIATSGH